MTQDGPETVTDSVPAPHPAGEAVKPKLTGSDEPPIVYEAVLGLLGSDVNEVISQRSVIVNETVNYSVTSVNTESYSV